MTRKRHNEESGWRRVHNSVFQRAVAHRSNLRWPAFKTFFWETKQQISRCISCRKGKHFILCKILVICMGCILGIILMWQFLRVLVKMCQTLGPGAGSPGLQWRGYTGCEYMKPFPRDGLVAFMRTWVSLTHQGKRNHRPEMRGAFQQSGPGQWTWCHWDKSTSSRPSGAVVCGIWPPGPDPSDDVGVISMATLRDSSDNGREHVGLSRVWSLTGRPFCGWVAGERSRDLPRLRHDCWWFSWVPLCLSNDRTAPRVGSGLGRRHIIWCRPQSGSCHKAKAVVSLACLFGLGEGASWIIEERKSAACEPWSAPLWNGERTGPGSWGEGWR